MKCPECGHNRSPFTEQCPHCRASIVCWSLWGVTSGIAALLFPLLVLLQMMHIKSYPLILLTLIDLGVVLFTGLASQINRSLEFVPYRKGESYGAVGLGLSIVYFAALIFLFLYLVGHEPSPTTQCASNLRQVGSALQMYCADNNGKLPPLKGDRYWMDQLVPYAKSEMIFQCTLDKSLKKKPLVSGSICGLCSYVARDYIRIPKANGSFKGKYVFGSLGKDLGDLSVTAIMRCSRGLLDDTDRVDTAEEASTYTYTNYAKLYGVESIQPEGKQPVIGSKYPSKRTLSTFVHSEGTNYFYLDGHVKWLSKEKILISCTQQLHPSKSSWAPNAF